MRQKLNFLILAVILLMAVIFLLALSFRYAGPADKRVANFSARSMSVTWMTDKLSGGCVIAVEKPLNKIELVKAWLSFGRNYRGSGIVKECGPEKHRAHMVDLSGLKQETAYYLILQQGLRLDFEFMPPFTTPAISAAAPGLPIPAYGSVKSNNGTPVVDAVVYLYRYSKTDHFPLAAIPNQDGNYAFDIANLPLTGESLILEVKNGLSQTRVETDLRTHSPFPTLIID